MLLNLFTLNFSSNKPRLTLNQFSLNWGQFPELIKPDIEWKA